MTTTHARTDPQTTEQGEWVLAYLSGDGRYYPATRQSPVLVRANDKSATDLTDAASNPANVLLVSAYPDVVKALEDLTNASDAVLSAGMTDGAARRHLPSATGKAAAVLAAVHPAEVATDE